MTNLETRVQRLESHAPDDTRRNIFLWGSGQSLADALSVAKLTLDDKPLSVIRLNGVKPGGGDQPECPLYLRDRHLLN